MLKTVSLLMKCLMNNACCNTQSVSIKLSICRLWKISNQNHIATIWRKKIIDLLIGWVSVSGEIQWKIGEREREFIRLNIEETSLAVIKTIKRMNDGSNSMVKWC